MKKYLIQFEIQVPDQISEKEVSDWTKYMIGYSGSVKENNPLIKKSFDPQFGSFVIKETK